MLGSLSLGGYDSSRIIPNSVNFTLAPDVTRDIVVGLQSITATFENGTADTLLANSTWSFIDSTLPYLYLPLESCQLYEKTLGLTWNDTLQLYPIDDALHQKLVQSNFNFTFQLGNSLNQGPTVNINLPYTAFDLTGTYPFTMSELPIRYFPLKRAANDSQVTLGRTFLQEA